MIAELSMVPVRHIKAKVCLVGDAAVGKTSLIRRFVLSAFDEHYLTTIGTKVSKKELEFQDGAGNAVRVDLAIWDIMGQPRIRELLEDSYFAGANAILAVCDLTRPLTLDRLGEWVDSVVRVAGTVPIVLAVNKADRTAAAGFSSREVEGVARAYRAPILFTSAKTGANVEAAFRELGQLVLVEPQADLPVARS